MKKDLTNDEIFAVTKAIVGCINKNRKNFKWNYCLQKNYKIVQGIMKDIQAALPTAPEGLKPMEISADPEAKAEYDRVVKIYNETVEKKAYDDEMLEIGLIEQDVDFYEIEINDVPTDADAAETSLFINYLTKN